MEFAPRVDAQSFREAALLIFAPGGRRGHTETCLNLTTMGYRIVSSSVVAGQWRLVGTNLHVNDTGSCRGH